MKQFIYLDTDMVNSIIAQKDKGLVLDIASELEKTTGDNTAKGVSLSANGSVQGGIWKFAQAQAEMNGTGNLTFSNHSQAVLKEIENKTLHDAAFDIAYEQICKEWDTNPENADLGAFIELKSLFEFVDLEYIGNLFSEGNDFMKVMKKSDLNKVEVAVKAETEANSNRSESRSNAPKVRQRLKELSSQLDETYTNMSEIVSVLRQIIPYKRLLVSEDGYLIPLEDKYFRVNPHTMGFKYGGFITCVGYITNVIGEAASSLATGTFSQLQHIVNNTLINALQIKQKDLFVVHPIAVYYGQ